MSSLGTDEGIPRKQNFHKEILSYGKWKTRSWIDGVQQPDSAEFSLYLPGQVVDIYHGRDLPNFHKRKSQGELLPFTPYVKVTHSLSAKGRFDMTSWTVGGHTYANQRIPVGHAYSDGFLTFNSNLPSYDVDLLSTVERWLKNRNIDPAIYTQAAASKLYSRGFDGGTFLAQLGLTISLIRNALRSLASLVTDYGAYLAKVKASTTIATPFNLWLEGRYGWRLLLYDIMDISDAVQHLNAKEDRFVKERQGANFAWTDTLTSSSTTSSMTETYTDIRTVSVKARGAVVADFLPPNVSFNPIVTAIDLIPYGFVVDWLFSISAAIQSLSFLIFEDQYTASASYVVTVKRTGSLALTPLAGAIYNAYQNIDQNYEVIYRKPTFVPLLPSYVNRLDLPKVTDLVALLVQLIAKIGR